MRSKELFTNGVDSIGVATVSTECPLDLIRNCKTSRALGAISEQTVCIRSEQRTNECLPVPAPNSSTRIPNLKCIATIVSYRRYGARRTHWTDSAPPRSNAPWSRMAAAFAPYRIASMLRSSMAGLLFNIMMN